MKRELHILDLWMIVLVCVLAIFGIAVIGSALDINVNGNGGIYTSQKIWFVLGLFLLVLTMFVDYHFICKFYIPIYVLNIILLIAVLIQGRLQGESVARWLGFGFAGIQPSEFTKIFMIIFLSKFVDSKKESVNSIGLLAAFLALVIVPVYLIQMQPSLSASLVVAFISLSILYFANLSYKYILAALGIVVPLGAFLVYDMVQGRHIIIDKILSKILTEYQIGRILSFINPENNSDAYFQTNQSISAIGSGQLRGKGLYNGQWYVPESHNDFVFSVIGEEFGFIGCVAVLALMLGLIIGCFIIAYRSVDFLGKLLAAGVGSMIAFQTITNIGVVTGMLPNTGMPLPFISYGGSSMWINMIAIGLVMNVGMTKHKSLFEG